MRVEGAPREVHVGGDGFGDCEVLAEDAQDDGATLRDTDRDADHQDARRQASSALVDPAQRGQQAVPAGGPVVAIRRDIGVHLDAHVVVTADTRYARSTTA